MITIKSKEEIEVLKEGGKKLASILRALKEKAKAGVHTKELDDLARELCEKEGGAPSFLNYRPRGQSRPYPASVCISINDEIVHGIPNEEDKILKEGDIVGIDMGFVYKGLITDAAVTVGVGNIDQKSKVLMAATEEALYAGIKAAKGGQAIGDIGFAVTEVAERHGFSVAEDLAGHGVGYAVHEDPFIPNFGEKGVGSKLKPGMVIAIEPMLNVGGGKIQVAEDGYTIKTADGSRSAHFEHTIVITKGEAEIITK